MKSSLQNLERLCAVGVAAVGPTSRLGRAPTDSRRAQTVAGLGHVGRSPPRAVPTRYDSSEKHICFWPSRLSVTADPSAGSWSLEVTAFEETWVALPGSDDIVALECPCERR